MTHTLKVGDEIRITGLWMSSSHGDLKPSFKVGDAPTGGRHVYMGDIDPKPFCFIFPLGSCIDNTGLAYGQLQARKIVDINDTLYIDGYGYFSMKPSCPGDHDNVKITALPR